MLTVLDDYQGVALSFADWSRVAELYTIMVITEQRSGGWQHTVGVGLAGHTLGVVGLGRLGARVAQLAQAFQMDVCAWSRHLDPVRAHRLGVRPVSKQELFADSDVASLHMRLSPETTGLIGRQELAWMRPASFLANTSRGPLVDEPALVDALSRGGIAGAGLDVFDVEPLPTDHVLRRTPNVLLLPHIGYVTTDAYRIFYSQAVEDVLAHLAGRPLRVLA